MNCCLEGRLVSKVVPVVTGAVLDALTLSCSLFAAC